MITTYSEWGTGGTLDGAVTTDPNYSPVWSVGAGGGWGGGSSNAALAFKF